MKRALLDLLWPPKCPFCGKVLDGIGICESCREELPSAPESEFDRAEGITCIAPFPYEGMVREAILRLKFTGASSAARPLGLLLGDYLARQELSAFDVITWVPLSRKRRWKRGYDQAKLLAFAAAEVLGVPAQSLLKKTVEVPAQSSLHELAARRANVLGVYDGLKAAEGKRVLLLDDVCTTGCTMSECARALREAGAEAVMFAAVAVAVKKDCEQNESTPCNIKEVSI